MLEETVSGRLWCDHSITTAMVLELTREQEIFETSSVEDNYEVGTRYTFVK